MYLTSHRVVSPSKRREGVNSFYYLHGHEWNPEQSDDFLPDINPGVLRDDAIQVSPPGNRVRSYLDIVGPDSLTLSELNRFLDGILCGPPPGRLPFSRVAERIWCRFYADTGLAQVWRQELRVLFQHVMALAARHMPQ